MSSAPRQPVSVTYNNISAVVYAYGYPYGTAGSDQPRAKAAGHITAGHRTIDHHGFDLTIEWNADGTGRVVRGDDPYCAYQEKDRLKVLARAATATSPPSRLLTDYEMQAIHDIEACQVPNCDYPTHFGGREDGVLQFEPADKQVKPSDQEGLDQR